MKRSILFGVLAMFAVSALSVQNLNAQNDATSKKPSIDKPQVNNADQAPANNKDGKTTNAINEPKEKPSPIKGDEVNKDKQGNVKSEANEPQSMRDMQNPQGEKNVTSQKVGKKPTTMEKTNKKSRPKMVKNTKMKNDAKPSVKNDNKKDEGNEGKPAIKKDAKNDVIKNDAKPNESNVNKKDDGKDKPAIKKDTKKDVIKNNTQSNVKKENKEAEGGMGQQNKTTKLQKKEVPAKPNSVPRPKQKIEQGTGTVNNNAAD